MNKDEPITRKQVEEQEFMSMLTSANAISGDKLTIAKAIQFMVECNLYLTPSQYATLAKFLISPTAPQMRAYLDFMTQDE